MIPQAGALYLAGERGAFEPELAEPEPVWPPATAPLVECAAAHCGLSLEAFVAVIMRELYGDD